MWCCSQNFIYLFLIVLSAQAFAAPQHNSKKISVEEMVEIKQFADTMYEAGLGTLMTPSNGVLSPAVRQTQKMLDDMINELVPALRRDGVSIVVNIYASAQENAFVRQMNPTVENSQEYEWNSRQQRSWKRKIWPLREAWGFRDDGNPIYEIGLTSALIEALFSKDALAFALGHELKHLTEGHTDPKQKTSELARHWWDSQAREGVADDGSLQYMVGKYELEAALTVLNIIHPPNEDQVKLREAIYHALDRSAKPHHAEGVRFTLVQSRINFMRTQDDSAAPRPETPLPDFVKEFKRQARARVKVKPAYWAGRVETAFKKLESENVTKKEKIKSILQTLFNYLPEGEKNPLRLLSPELKYRIKKFLIQNSKGEGAWTMDDFLVLNRKSWSVRNGYLGLFMASPEGLKFISDLGVIVPEWKKFYDFWSSLQSFERSGDRNGRSISFYELKEYVENLGNHNPLKILEPVRLQLRTQLIQSITESNSHIFYNSESSGVGNFYDFLLKALEETDLPKKDPAWLLELQKAFQPHVREYVQEALNKIRELGILKNKNGLFIKYFNQDELNEALQIVEKEVLAVEHTVYPSDLTADAFFIICELLKKYQSDQNKLWLLVKKTFWLESNEEVRKSLIDSLSNLPKDLIFNEVVDLYKSYDAKLLVLWLGSQQGRKIIAELSFDEMMQLFERLCIVGQDDIKMTYINKLGVSTENLFALLTRYFNRFKSSTELINIYVRLTQLGGTGFMLHPRLLPVFKVQLMQALSKLPLPERIHQLKQNQLWLVLGPQYVGEQVALYARSRTEPDLAERVKRTMEEIPLQKDWMEAFRFFREKFTEAMQLQPSNVHTVFPKDERSDTERARDHDSAVRALSAFSTFVKEIEINKQIEIIEYMMGRQDRYPDELERASQIINDDISNNGLTSMVLKGVDARLIFLQFREKLQFQGPIERAFAINTVLAGRNSIIATSEGLKKVIERILEPVSAENKPMARTILNALLKAEGKNKSLILSYILAQKPPAGESKLTEAMVLRSLLDFYGVPGVKLAQYLAFTAAFKNFTAALESYQNAAMPISFYDALVLVQKHLGDKWDPEKYRLTQILGSGSVNIAIEYENLKTGKLEVLTISRDQIETKTKDDFRRFKLLIEAAMESEDRDKIEFLIGLLRIIEKSVSLEFDKPHAYKMQKGVHKIYRKYVDEWRVQSVDAFEVMDNFGIRMQKAPGIGAIEMMHSDPATYNSAMRALMSVEYEILRGVAGKDTYPIPLYANPDFHNGQVLIDAERRTVTILDFGQTVEISNAEREFALDVLMVITKAVDEAGAMKLLSKNMKLFSAKDVKIDPSELSKILKRNDGMEIFVYLFSYLERSGFEAPLPVVHWLLGAHRLAKLGENVGVSLESSFTWLLGMRKFGIPLSVFNAGKVVLDNVSTQRKDLQSRSNSHSNVGSAVRCEKLFISAE